MLPIVKRVFAKQNEIFEHREVCKDKTRIDKIYTTKGGKKVMVYFANLEKNPFISQCGIFIFYHTWYDLPKPILPLMVLSFDPINIFSFMVIITLPN